MSSAKDAAVLGLTAVASLWGAGLTWQVHAEIRERQAKHSTYPQYEDFVLTLQTFAALLGAQLIFRRFFSVVARAAMPKKPRWSQLVWDAKVSRCCDAVFKCGFYIIATVSGFLILRQQSWTPWALGGQGSTRHCWTDSYPDQPVQAPLRNYYLAVLGFQLSEVAMLLLETRHPDFCEMFLHHLVTCFLMCFSYLLNYVRIGSLVMMLHGATDIFIYASKAVVDTHFNSLSIACYVALIVAYAWFRIYVFPVHVMSSAWVESVEEAGGALYAWGFFNFALWVLLLLHMYWFGLIVKMGWQYHVTGERRDLQSNLSRMELFDDKKKKAKSS